MRKTSGITKNIKKENFFGKTMRKNVEKIIQYIYLKQIHIYRKMQKSTDFYIILLRAYIFIYIHIMFPKYLWMGEMSMCWLYIKYLQ